MSPDEMAEHLKGGDPTKSSRIERPDESQPPVGHSLNSLNERRPILAGSEGLFYKIENVPEMQQFISRILKPFLNVADIVKTETGWYSYKPPMENIERIEYAAQHYGDAMLIALLTSDRDRLGAGNYIYEAGSSLQFDFEGAYYFWTDWSAEDLEAIRKWLERQSNTELSLHFSDKLEKMWKYYESTDGHDQMKAAFKASGKQMSELFRAPTDGTQPTFEDFYKEFVRRVSILKEIAKG